MIGKKAGFALIVSLVMLVLVLLAGLAFVRSLVSSGESLAERIEECVSFRNFDNDDKLDCFDPCPCNTNDARHDFNGKAYCDAEITQQSCNFYINNYGYVWIDDAKRSDTYCGYTKDACNRYIKSAKS